jgi:hypothetical protein
VIRVLVGCEKSGAVRDAFRALGAEAWSVDVEPAEVDANARGLGHIYHLRGDVRRVLAGHIPADMVSHSSYRKTPTFIRWDLAVMHPECRYLCSSGIHWNKRRPERAGKTAEAYEFALELWNAPIPRLALENSVGVLSTLWRKPDQIVQPYQFGHDASKQTALWLRGLSPLRPTKWIEPRYVCCGEVLPEGVGLYGCPNCCGDKRALPRWSNQTNSGQNRLSPSPTRSAQRAATYPGIAAAMAATWLADARGA